MSNREALKEGEQGRHRDTLGFARPLGFQRRSRRAGGRTSSRELCTEASAGRQGKMAPTGRGTRREEPGAEV